MVDGVTPGLAVCSWGRPLAVVDVTGTKGFLQNVSNFFGTREQDTHTQIKDVEKAFFTESSQGIKPHGFAGCKEVVRLQFIESPFTTISLKLHRSFSR